MSNSLNTNRERGSKSSLISYLFSFKNKLPLLLLVVVSFCFVFPQPTVAAACAGQISSFHFTKNLKFGMTGNDVKELQKYLNNNGYPVAKNGLGSKGKESSFFGTLTQSALRKFQTSNNIVVSTYGALDVTTRDYLSCTKHTDLPDLFTFTRDLKLGMTGNDVKELQKYLNNNGYPVAKNGLGSKGKESSFFGTLTQSALKRFQDAKLKTTLTQAEFGSLLINTRNYINNREGASSYVLNYSAGPNGKISGINYQTVLKGESGTPVTATPNNDFYFLNWSDGHPLNPRTDSNVTGNKSVVANFAYLFNNGGGGSPAVTSVVTPPTDSTDPVISEVTPISTPAADSSPDYTFTTDEAGTISYGGDCSSATTSATIGSNTVTFSALSDGVHTNCTLYVTDASLNQSNVISITSFTVDTTAPVGSNDSPTGALPLDTTSTTIALDTDETAVCKYSVSSGTAYGSMTAFSSTNNTSHSSSVSGLTNGGSYTYYVKCADALSNTNATDFTISFTVAADTTAPTVSLTAPSNNAIVSGNSVTVSANASDDVAVVGVQFKRDTSTNIGAEDTSSPYSISWDSTGVSDGAHTLIAVARDAATNSTTSSTISVTVDNTGPIVSITAPSSSATVAGSAVTLSANASDAVAVAGVTFKIGGVTVGSEDTSSPYSISWDSTGAADGSQTVTAVARDSSGNLTTSSGVSFTVDNADPVISSISSGSPSDTEATITWTTDENADSQVDYGLTASYGSSTVLDATLATSHSVAVTGLTASTLYHYRVRSTDAYGNLSVSSDQTFTTGSISWIPSASSVLADSFADYSTEGGTNHYWNSSTVYNSASAYLSAVSGTFSRASTGYYGASSGLLASASTDAMRFDYDQNSLAAKGILLEGPTTNLMSPSESALVGWTKRNVTATEGAAVAPDGTTTAIKMVETSATDYHYITETGAANIISVFAKAGERDWVWLDAYDGSTHITYFNVATGTIGTNAAGNTATIIPYPNGWYLVSIRRAITTSVEFGVASADNAGIYAGDSSKGAYFWGMDARYIVDGTLDSYIRTTGAPSAPRLIGYWDMDETGTGTRADATGNGFTMTNNNAVTNGTGVLNNASSFTRTSSQSVSHADALALRPGAASFGVSVWVKFTSFANFQDIISKWAGTLASNEFTLEASSTGSVGFYVSNGTTARNATWGSNLSTGTWYNIVGWYDSTASTINITVNNGTPVSTAHTGGATCSTCAARLMIGAADTAVWTPFVNGLIDEVAYFTGVPDSSDRTFIYGAGTPPDHSGWPAVSGGSRSRAEDFLHRTVASSPSAITKVIAGRTPKTLPLTYQILYHLDNGTEAEDFEVYRDSTGHLLVEVHAGGISQGVLDMGVIANDTDFKIAFRGRTNDLAASINGGAAVKDTSVTWPTTFTTERWGVNAYVDPRSWNSTIKSDATFLSAVSDADLQTLSTP